MRVTLAIGFGLLLAANGFLMLFDPAQWYAMVPGVPETGAFNPHFVRDIGAAYVVAGVAIAWLARDARAVGETLTVDLDDPDARNPDLVDALKAAGARIRYVERLQHSLEDVYLRLVGGHK